MNNSGPPKKKLKQCTLLSHVIPSSQAATAGVYQTATPPNVQAAASDCFETAALPISKAAASSHHQPATSTSSQAAAPNSFKSIAAPNSHTGASTGHHPAALPFQLQETPYHPPMTFSFPKTKNRSCKSEWFQKWMWLHYVVGSDAVVCYYCALAYKRTLINLPKECAFVTTGFRTWNKASNSFQAHESSQLHQDSCVKLQLQDQVPIHALLCSAARQAHQTAQKALDIIFSSIKFLARQGFPLQGDDNRDGAFYQLVRERSRHFPDVDAWVNRRDNWMSDTVQNEILQQYAHAIQRSIVEEAQQSEFLGIIADGTTDVSGNEQFAVTLQYVLPGDLSSKNMFIGFYNSPESTGETLHKVILDIFCRLNIQIDRVQGYCFDGASNMSGSFQGVQARLKTTCPYGLYLHCSNHSLDLCLQEVAREVPLVAEALQFVKDTSNTIRESAKRKAQYESLFGNGKVTSLLSLCPTRWSVRSGAIKRVIAAYPQLLCMLNQLGDDMSVRADSRARIRGLQRQAKSSKVYFGLLISAEIFLPCEDLAKGLQRRGLTALGAIEATSKLTDILMAMREHDRIEELLTKCEEMSSSLQLKIPLKRNTQTPQRFRHNDSASEENLPHRVEWKRQYLEALDLVTGELKRRFQQPGMKIAAKREQVIIRAIFILT